MQQGSEGGETVGISASCAKRAGRREDTSHVCRVQPSEARNRTERPGTELTRTMGISTAETGSGQPADDAPCPADPPANAGRPWGAVAGVRSAHARRATFL
jgi:hypothetical protein